MPFLTPCEIVPRPFERPEVLHTLLQRKNGAMPLTRKIFLYYGIRDIERVQPVVNILKSLRINLFVDYPDPALLTERISFNDERFTEPVEAADKLIFLNTPESGPDPGHSHNWSDRLIFNTNRSAIFPLTLDPKHWENGSRYSDCAFISKKFSYINFPGDWQVEFPGGDALSLKEWILLMPPNTSI